MSPVDSEEQSGASWPWPPTAGTISKQGEVPRLPVGAVSVIATLSTSRSGGAGLALGPIRVAGSRIKILVLQGLIGPDRAAAGGIPVISGSPDPRIGVRGCQRGGLRARGAIAAAVAPIPGEMFAPTNATTSIEAVYDPL